MPEHWKEWEGRVAVNGHPLLRYLGGSPRSAVFLTEHGKPESRPAAIKLVSVQPERLPDEVSRLEWAAKLSHPHLIALLGAGRCHVEGNELLSIVMEYAEENLSQVIPDRTLSAGEALNLVAPAMEALAYLHSKGWVHGGLKPSNFLAVGEELKISSDRIGRMGELRDRSWQPGPYDAPGVPGQRLSAAGDVWSLGVTLVEVMTQRLPAWEANAAAEPVMLQTLPPPFRDIAVHCLQPDPQDRWTIHEIATRLRQPSSSSAQPAAVSALPGWLTGWWSYLCLWQPWCPRCRSRDLTRSRRRNQAEKALGTLILPYRCGRCDARFFRWHQKES